MRFGNRETEMLGEHRNICDVLRSGTRHAFVRHRVDGSTYAEIAAEHIMNAIAALRVIEA